MAETITLMILVLAAFVTGLVWRNIRVRRSARRRLGSHDEAAPTEQALETVSAGPFVRSRPGIAYVGGCLLAVGLHYLAGLGTSFAVAFGLIAALLGAQLEQFRVQRKIALIEVQLADALDLMISALSAGTGVFQGMEAAAGESRAPLRPQIENLINRIRFGDDPQAVLQTLENNVPLATFRLFAAALSVHWEVGGSLTGPLAVVARTIRDRIELSRRVRSLTTQARTSIIAVMFTSYFIAAVMWRTDPARMAAFLRTSLGEWFIAAALILQGLGIVWSARLSRMKV
jgi:tight adherence protein B